MSAAIKHRAPVGPLTPLEWTRNTYKLGFERIAGDPTTAYPWPPMSTKGRCGDRSRFDKARTFCISPLFTYSSGATFAESGGDASTIVRVRSGHPYAWNVRAGSAS